MAEKINAYKTSKEYLKRRDNFINPDFDLRVTLN
jgi:hypothetical protein